jgi:hypothetical protein
MKSLVTCTISNILSCCEIISFIKFYKLQFSEVLNVLSYFSTLIHCNVGATLTKTLNNVLGQCQRWTLTGMYNGAPNY